MITLTISANGDVELFPLVLSLIKEAPSIKGWQFVAFRQRLSFEEMSDHFIGYDDNVYHEIDIRNDIMFLPISNSKNELALIFFIKNLSKNNFNDLANLTLKLMDFLLGEVDSVTKIKGVEFRILPNNDGELIKLETLSNLALVVDGFYHKSYRRK